MNIVDYAKIFNFHGRGVYALGRVVDTFLEVQLFDLLRNVNTASIKTNGYSDNRYMIYQPVYTSVCKEMIRKSFEWYRSGIKYSNDNLMPIYIDLGSGSGKTVLIAMETGFFEMYAGVELDAELHERSRKNSSLRIKSKNLNVLNILGNVENKSWVQTILEKVPENRHSNIVPFIFNKNSYNNEVVRSTLDLAKDHFKNIMYLYQNPIHHKEVLASNFHEVQRDSQKNSAHKNKKYIIYHYSGR
ncbi:MAG: hypothetical protein CMP34_04440 [Rickettsiales bacterium]|nr:hypothetical protein [Rickettsiales bacterium]